MYNNTALLKIWWNRNVLVDRFLVIIWLYSFLVHLVNIIIENMFFVWIGFSGYWRFFSTQQHQHRMNLIFYKNVCKVGSRACMAEFCCQEIKMWDNVMYTQIIVALPAYDGGNAFFVTIYDTYCTTTCAM